MASLFSMELEAFFPSEGGSLRDFLWKQALISSGYSLLILLPTATEKKSISTALGS
jgi:hypothetical protein